MKYPEYMHDRAVHLYEKGYTCEWISQRIGVSDQKVRIWLKERGVCLRRGPAGRSHTYDYSRLMNLYNAGYRDIEISRELSIPPVTIQQYRRRRNLPANNLPLNVASRAMCKNLKEHVTIEDKDDESLFCDGDFLEELLQKPIERIVGK